MARRELAARDDIIRGEDLWLWGIGVFIRILYSIHLSGIQTSTPKIPRTAQKAPAPKAPQHHYQPSHPQASTSAKTQPPRPLFPAPFTSHSSLHPPVNPPFPSPCAFPPSNSLSPPPQTQKPHTGVSSPLYHPNPDPRSFRRRWRRRRILGWR